MKVLTHECYQAREYADSMGADSSSVPSTLSLFQCNSLRVVRVVASRAVVSERSGEIVVQCKTREACSYPANRGTGISAGVPVTPSHDRVLTFDFRLFQSWLVAAAPPDVRGGRARRYRVYALRARVELHGAEYVDRHSLRGTTAP